MSVQEKTHDTRRASQSYVLPVIAYSVIYTLLYLIPNLLPLYTGILIELGGLDPSQAGGVNSSYLGAMTVAALGAAFLLTKISARNLSLIAVAVQVVGFCIPFVFSGTSAVVLAMIIAGLGNGALFAVVNASAAQEKHPVLIYGAGIVLSSLGAAAIPTPLYAAVGQWSVPGMFVVPLAMIPLVVLSLFVLPRRSVSEVLTDAALPQRTTRSPFTAGAIALLAAIFLTNLFNMIFYNFADRVLAQAGFEAEAIGSIFTNVYLMAAVGGLISCFMARWPRRLLLNLIVVTALLLGAILLATGATNPALIVNGLYGEALLAMLVISVQLAVAAQIDETGRVAATASGILFASWTAGPILGGWIIEAFGFTGIFNVSAVLGPLSIALLLVVRARTRKSSPTLTPSVAQDIPS